MSGFDDDSGVFGQPSKGKRNAAHDDQMERTYDLLWHDLIQHRAGKGSEADKTIMPKIMRELAPGGTFFDPRTVWEAEQDRVRESEDEERRKQEEEEKKRLEEEKRQERLQNKLKKGSLKDGEEAEGAARAPTPFDRASPVPGGDVKWRNEFATKIAQARKTVEAEYDTDADASDKVDEVFNDFVSKMEKIWGDSAKASTKSQKTECEKKIEKLVKTAAKQLKEAKQEEGAGAGKKKKSDLIREKLDAKKQVDDVEDDVQMISNVLSKFKRSLIPSLMGLKDNLKTPLGRLQWMLEVIKAGMDKRPRDDVLILDCLFALIEMPLFVNARKEVKQREKERKKAKDKKEKDKDKDKKKKKEKEEEKEIPLSREGTLISQFSDTIDEVMGILKDIDDVIEFQLVNMANRLPPLSRFSFGRSLDAWQKKVLSLIDQKRSVIVCAPTSSGKTVLSSYVTMRADKILFVVPTEPLVWQVAAMFYKVLGGEVAVVTNQIVYNPKREDPKDWRCIVGTPLALESALTKPRGREGAEMLGQQDFSTFRGGLHEFEYVIYDEVHTLDGDEGAALQRIIKGVRCNFLALSATIGNGEELRDGWQSVHDAHVDDEIAEVEAMLRGENDETREEGEDYDMLSRVVRVGYAELTPAQGDLKSVKGRWMNIRSRCRENAKAEPPVAQDIIVRTRPEQTTVELVDHKARFINLQRWVWVGDKLKHLHPLSAVSMESLEKSGFAGASLPFTPFDSYKLWEVLRDNFDEEVVEDVDPTEVLGGKRITLERSRDYEDLLKDKLQALSKKNPAVVSKILSTFAPNAAVTEQFKLLDVVFHMKANQFFPSIFFRLDTYSCVELFKLLLVQLEVAELERHPTYYEDLSKKREEQEELTRKARDAAEKRKDKKIKKRVDEDGNRIDEKPEDDEGPEINVPPPVDDTAPHPDFVLSSPVNRITDMELTEMLEKLAKDNMGSDHPYIKALRRGFGLYVDDSHTQEYRRIVQQLAQQGKLAVVFSDHSLAYGVNMPFRTSTFCGDDPGLLTPLMAAQMSGRAGRRGLDEQGNLVYLGMPWDRIKVLMLGCIPAIRGRDPRYPTIALQHVLSQYHNQNSVEKTDRVRFFPEYINENRIRAIAGTPLEDFFKAKETGQTPAGPSDPTYYLKSLKALEDLGFIRVEKETGADGVEKEVKVLLKAPGILALLWELREYPAEGVAVVHALPWIMRKITPILEKKTKGYTFKQWSKKVKIETVEADFLTMILPVIDRVRAKETSSSLHEEGFVVNNPIRAAVLRDVEELLRRSKTRIEKVAEEERRELLLKVPPGATPEEPTPLDSTLFKLVVMRKTLASDPSLAALNSADWFSLKQRLWKVGSVIRLMHNCLGLLGTGDELMKKYLVFLLWKTFRRIWYIMRDSFTGATLEGIETGEEEDDGSDGDEEREEAGASGVVESKV